MYSRSQNDGHGTGRAQGLENPGKKLGRGRAKTQAQKKAGKRLDSLKESPFFSKPKET